MIRFLSIAYRCFSISTRLKNTYLRHWKMFSKIKTWNVHKGNSQLFCQKGILFKFSRAAGTSFPAKYCGNLHLLLVTKMIKCAHCKNVQTNICSMCLNLYCKSVQKVKCSPWHLHTHTSVGRTKLDQNKLYTVQILYRFSRPQPGY